MKPALTALLGEATNVFMSASPVYRDVRLPYPYDFFSGSSPKYFVATGLWTKDGLRPNWGNPGAVVDEVTPEKNLNFWHATVRNLGIPLIALAGDDQYIIVGTNSQERLVEPDRIRQELEQQRYRLFSPKALGRLRTGQLSFAELENRVTEESFAYQMRHRANLSTSLQNAISKAIDEQPKEIESIVIVAMAYLAARILEDKGFFDNKLPTDDPKELLGKTIAKVNGFFRYAYETHLSRVKIPAMQQLALYLGSRAIFTLITHRDVGHFYEEMMQVLRQKNAGFDLEQHYTPIAIADRMLNCLPLERFRPEERVIFDPAAGSGSLLLAATRRLASMPDVSSLSNYDEYLADQVIGNDIDSTARLVTQIRYVLIQETVGKASLFPQPKLLRTYNYEHSEAWDLPKRPRVVIANPPFSEDGDIQRAVGFINIVASRFKKGDMFSFVLPQTFLTGTTHGLKEARRLLSSQCRFFEIWQMPEGSVGITARQSVCVITGEVGMHTSPTYSISRSVISGAQIENVRDGGFLGQSWIADIKENTVDWNSAVAPQPLIQASANVISDLYYICTGIGPLEKYPPLSEKPQDVPSKFFWKHGWHQPGGLWLNPRLAPSEHRYIRFGRNFLEGHRSNQEWVYDSHKVLVSRSTNRNSDDPVGAQLDTTGVCPTKDMFCIVPLPKARQSIKSVIVPTGWSDLTFDQKLFWLVGILSSNLAIDWIMAGRDPRHLRSATLKAFPLPLTVDTRIINLVGEIISQERYLSDSDEISSRVSRREYENIFTALREQLDQLVEASYGYPKRKSVSLIRTGKMPEIEVWKAEQVASKSIVTGQVINVRPETDEILIDFYGMASEAPVWIPLPQELPGWALEGVMFEAEVNESLENPIQLITKRWSLSRFKHTPTPYLSSKDLYDDLMSELGKPS